MDLEEKVTDLLLRSFEAKFVLLDNDEVITGFVVSSKFEGVTAFDRQGMIDDLLREALTREERRQVLMIAALTPREYDSIGSSIRVHTVEKLADGSVRVVLKGTKSDAEYVRHALVKQPEVEASEPQSVPGAGFFMAFEAKGSEAHPLTKEQAESVLSQDAYIHLMPNH